MKDNLTYEKGDLSPKTIAKVYNTGKENSIAQKKRNIVIGDRLKLLRTQKKIMQKDLCDEINVVITTYAGYENGKHEPPSEILVRLADFYNVSLDYIVGRTDNPKGIFAEEENKDLSERVAQLEKLFKESQK
ncbi:MAG: helix-turn-helix transcriptional regulator [Ruminococcus sp.]|nr:helix-turn-helix transcriptional regulator [Ruminococcus sp.]